MKLSSDLWIRITAVDARMVDLKFTGWSCLLCCTEKCSGLAMYKHLWICYLTDRAAFWPGWGTPWRRARMSDSVFWQRCSRVANWQQCWNFCCPKLFLSDAWSPLSGYLSVRVLNPTSDWVCAWHSKSCCYYPTTSLRLWSRGRLPAF